MADNKKTWKRIAGMKLNEQNSTLRKYYKELENVSCDKYKMNSHNSALNQIKSIVVLSRYLNRFYDFEIVSKFIEKKNPLK